MNKPLCRLALAAAMIASCLSSAHAVVIVAEDFLYNEPTKALFDFAGFTRASYGGGQNGPGGIWDDRWTAIGGVMIVGTDNPAPPPMGVADNPHTAVITEVATAASLQRPFLATGEAAAASTIYFAADIKVGNFATPQIFCEFGIISPSNNIGAPTLSMGLTDSQGAVSPTFFAEVGNTTVVADPGANPANLVPEDTYVRMVGKLEINAVAGGADFDDNGVTDANDFVLWQRQLGSNVPANTGADADGNGMVDAADLTAWRSGFGGLERLTVYFNPTGLEATAATVLTATGQLINGINDLGTGVARAVSLNGLANVGDNDRPHYVDNIAIGTTWADVAAVTVPRLTLEVNKGSGQVRLINNSTTAFDLSYYEILSTEGALRPTEWNSLDEQETSGGAWVENNPTANQLIESNFTGSTTIAASGGVLNLGAAFTPGGAETLVARWGVKQGFDGLLNLANVTYVTGIAAVPEPAAWCLLALGAPLLRRRVRGA
jgi:hypothetical protein